MKKTHRIAFRTSEEVRDRLKEQAYLNQRDSMSQEARAIIEKALGIKRTKRAEK
jgi:hypothetical protein